MAANDSDGTTGSTEPPAIPDRRRRAALALAAALIGSLVAGIVVFAGAGEESATAGLDPADGAVVAIEAERVVLDLTRPVDGRDRLELAIRPGEADGLDVEHLEFHGAIGDPVRIYYERDGGEYVARRSEELPGFR